MNDKFTSIIQIVTRMKNALVMRFAVRKGAKARVLKPAEKMPFARFKSIKLLATVLMVTHEIP